MNCNRLKRVILPCVVLAGTLALTGCMDDGYDFNEVDMTVGIGGDGLSLPVSSTDTIKLEDVLELDGSESVVVKDNGDYVFEQTGDDVAPVHPAIDPIVVSQAGAPEAGEIVISAVPAVGGGYYEITAGGRALCVAHLRQHAEQHVEVDRLGHVRVHAGLGGAGADCRPGDDVGDVLGDDRVEHFGGDRQPDVDDAEHQLAGDEDPFFDVVGLVEIRVVDQPLPADGGAGFLEIGAHHQQDMVLHLVAQLAEPLGIFDRRTCVVKGTRTHDHQEFLRLAVEDVADFPPGLHDLHHRVERERQLRPDCARAGKHAAAGNIDIVAADHCWNPFKEE